MVFIGFKVILKTFKEFLFTFHQKNGSSSEARQISSQSIGTTGS
jgi:hypothetical protein